MTTIILNLLEDIANVPLMPIKINGVNVTITTLIDTGASMPVWVGSRQLLLSLNAASKNKKVPIAGFGGEIYGDLYEIPIFNIGGLTFTRLSVVYIKDFFSKIDEDGNKVSTDAPYHMILSATMFRGTIYEINDIDKLFKVTVPDDGLVRNVRIYSSDGKTYKVLVNLSDNNESHRSFAPH